MSALPPFPDQPRGVDWPTHAWPRGRARDALSDACAEALFAAPDRVGETHALLVVQGGRIVYARYADGFAATKTLPSWSIAKSVTHALCGLLVGDGALDIDAPANAPEWRSPGDARAAITLRDLLAMRSGLEFAEDYVERGVSDVMEMLWGSGKPDVAAYAAAKPLRHPVGAHHNYASGSTNIVARRLGEIVGGGAAMAAFMRERLFAPIGMASATPKFDAAGTFVGSSYCFCTAEDFARFGMLYLRGGRWDGRRLLPEGWAHAARVPTHVEPAGGHGHYGLHWWVNDGFATFYASGFDGQRIVIDPTRDALLVRLGRTSLAQRDAMHAALLGLLPLL